MAIESINPATGEKLESYAQMPRGEVDDAIVKAHEAFLAWRRKLFADRGAQGHAGL